MSDTTKILIIVEGKKDETNLFRSLISSFNINAEVYAVSTDLYSLYDKMESYGFDCEVKDAARELIKDEEMYEILMQDFAYTYLVFDSDLQHKNVSQRSDTGISNEHLAEYNFEKLKKLSEYFTNETDPTIGRLYINYPMIESYRFCNSFDDYEYLQAYIKIDDMKRFKSLASQKRLSGIHLKNYSRQNFLSLIKLNAVKLAKLFQIENDIEYEKYLDISEARNIARKQYELFKSQNRLCVLNHSLLIIVDYFGNRNSFFDDIFK